MTDDEKAAEEFILSRYESVEDQDQNDWILDTVTKEQVTDPSDLVPIFLAGIQHEREKHRWIAVTETLPGRYDAFFVYRKEYRPWNGTYYMKLDIQEFDPDTGNFSQGEITHWREIGELPE